jgi:hypothetical protein
MKKAITPAFALCSSIELPLTKFRLRAYHQFRPFDADAQLDQLIRWVAACLGLEGIELPIVRWPPSVKFQPDLADRMKTEWQAIVDLLAGRSSERILLFEGASGLGKSVLTRHAATYATKLAIPVVRVDFKGGWMDVAAILGQFDLDMGGTYRNSPSRAVTRPTFCGRTYEPCESPCS